MFVFHLFNDLFTMLVVCVQSIYLFLQILIKLKLIIFVDFFKKTALFLFHPIKQNNYGHI